MQQSTKEIEPKKYRTEDEDKSLWQQAKHGSPHGIPIPKP